MITFKKIIAAGMVSSLLVLSLTGTEFIKNGDFENGKIPPWRLDKPNKNVSLSIVTDSGSPCSGNGALGITLSGKDRRIDLSQKVKIGPGKYKLTAYMDTTRCTKPTGYIMIYLSGRISGKWHNFGGFSAGGTGKDGWKKNVWLKKEKIISVPEDGIIESVNITFASYLTGTVMLDGISIQDYSEEQEQKDLERKQKER